MIKDRMTNYYPLVVQSIRDIRAIIASEYPEFERLAENEQTVMSDAWLTDMEESRVSQWERLFKLPSAGTIEERRNFIMARFRGSLKMNYDNLVAMMHSYFTYRIVTIRIENGLVLEFFGISKGIENMERFKTELSSRLPAHLALEVVVHE